MKKTHALFMRSIVKQFFHTVLVSRRRIGRCEIFNLESSSSDYCRSVSCQHCTSYTLVMLYVSLSHQDEKYYVTSSTPPSLHPTAIWIEPYRQFVHCHLAPPPPPASVLMSTCTYFFVRHKLEETILDCHSEFIHHRMLLVSQNYKSFKYGMQNMKK